MPRESSLDKLCLPALIPQGSAKRPAVFDLKTSCSLVAAMSMVEQFAPGVAKSGQQDPAHQALMRKLHEGEFLGIRGLQCWTEDPKAHGQPRTPFCCLPLKGQNAASLQAALANIRKAFDATGLPTVVQQSFKSWPADQALKDLLAQDGLFLLPEGEEGASSEKRPAVPGSALASMMAVQGVVHLARLVDVKADSAPLREQVRSLRKVFHASPELEQQLAAEIRQVNSLNQGAATPEEAAALELELLLWVLSSIDVMVVKQGLLGPGAAWSPFTGPPPPGGPPAPARQELRQLQSMDGVAQLLAEQAATREQQKQQQAKTGSHPAESLGGSKSGGQGTASPPRAPPVKAPRAKRSEKQHTSTVSRRTEGSRGKSGEDGSRASPSRDPGQTPSDKRSDKKGKTKEKQPHDRSRSSSRSGSQSRTRGRSRSQSRSRPGSPAQSRSRSRSKRGRKQSSSYRSRSLSSSSGGHRRKRSRRSHRRGSSSSSSPDSDESSRSPRRTPRPRRSTGAVDVSFQSTTPEGQRYRSTAALSAALRTGTDLSTTFLDVRLDFDMGNKKARAARAGEMGGTRRASTALCLAFFIATREDEDVTELFALPSRLVGKGVARFDVHALLQPGSQRSLVQESHLNQVNKAFYPRAMCLPAAFESMEGWEQTILTMVKLMHAFAAEQGSIEDERDAQQRVNKDVQALLTLHMLVLRRLQNQQDSNRGANSKLGLAYCASVLYMYFATGERMWLTQEQVHLWSKLADKLALHCTMSTCLKLGHLSGACSRVEAYVKSRSITVTDPCHFKPSVVEKLPDPSKQQSQPQPSGAGGAGAGAGRRPDGSSSKNRPHSGYQQQRAPHHQRQHGGRDLHRYSYSPPPPNPAPPGGRDGYARGGFGPGGYDPPYDFPPAGHYGPPGLPHQQQGNEGRPGAGRAAQNPHRPAGQHHRQR